MFLVYFTPPPLSSVFSSRVLNVGGHETWGKLGFDVSHTFSDCRCKIIDCTKHARVSDYQRCGRPGDVIPEENIMPKETLGLWPGAVCGPKRSTLQFENCLRSIAMVQHLHNLYPTERDVGSSWRDGVWKLEPPEVIIVVGWCLFFVIFYNWNWLDETWRSNQKPLKPQTVDQKRLNIGPFNNFRY